MTTDAATPRDQAGFVLRSAAIWAALTLPLSRIVAPGLRGNAPDAMVRLWELLAAVASYGLVLLLGSVIVEASGHLLRKDHYLRGFRGVVLAAAFVSMALVGLACWRRLPAQPTIVMVLASSVVVLVTTGRTLAVPKLRALALVMGLFALAALVRLFAWQLAVAAGEQMNDRLYGTSRGIASVGVVFEAAAQLAAVAWLGTRVRVRTWGQVTTVVAIAIGFFLTWGATVGVHSDAARWQSILHTAMVEAQGIPAPYGLSAVATFLAASTFPLIIVAMSQRGDGERAGSALALALVAHGAFDAPLRAFAAAAAAVAILATEVDVTPKDEA